MASRVEYLNLLQAATSEVCQILELDEDTAMNLALAVHEAAVNAVKHGNRMDAAKQVKVVFTIRENELIMEVKDQGSGFAPEKVQDPRASGNIDKASGRGIFLIRHFVDKLEFHNVPGKGLTVSMVKKLRGGDGDLGTAEDRGERG
jgi:serine/threonine-protein kinase RsbW